MAMLATLSSLLITNPGPPSTQLASFCCFSALVDLGMEEGLRRMLALQLAHFDCNSKGAPDGTEAQVSTGST